MADVILEWYDDDGRHEKRLRDVELVTGEGGLTEPLEYEGRTFRESHSLDLRNWRRGTAHLWVVFREARPPK